jgi:O-Antigen ligase
MGGVKSVTKRVAEGLLTLLALVLPFEAPLFRLGPLQITTVELALYATLAAWGVGVAIDVAQGRTAWRSSLASLGRDEMARAVLLWAAVLFVSAAAAPSDRAAAFKFALRSLSGLLAFFAARSLARPHTVGRRVLLALVLGGLVSAAGAVIDWLVPGSATIWRAFHEGSFAAFGLRRASGVFGYPTIGAMYWEAIVPLLLVAPFAWRARARAAARWPMLLVVAGSAVLLVAILASATRSAIGGAVVGCAIVGILGRRAGPLVPRAAAGALAVLAALSIVALWQGRSGSPLGQRLQWWHDDRWFGARYFVPTAAKTVREGQRFHVAVSLENTGTIAWQHDGTVPTRLAYHWYLEPADGGPPRLVDFDGQRTELTEDVPPGGIVHLAPAVQAPDVAGTYRLSWDLVQETVTWFSDRGNPMGSETVLVGPASGTPAAEPVLPGAPAAVTPPASLPSPPPRPVLWRAAVALWRERPLLGVGPDNFRRRYEAVVPAPPSGRSEDTRIHANSLYFETLADLGLAGLAALVALAVALARALRRHAEARSLAGLGCAAAAAAFFVHGLLDYFFEFTPLFGLFWVTLGLTAAFEQGARASPAPPGSTP